MLGADIGAAEALGATEAPSTVELGDGRAGGLRRTRCSTASPWRSTRRWSTRAATASPATSARSCCRPRDGLLLFGADQAFTNDQVLRADNAAVALRLLGQDRPAGLVRPVRWTDLSADEGVSLTSLLPRLDLRPALWLVGLATASPSLVWRGPPARRAGHRAAARRRHAPSRPPAASGRLYRRAGDRAHAAARAAALGPVAVRRAAAARVPVRPGRRSCARWPGAPGGRRPRSPTCSTRPPGDPGPTTDRDLITLAQALAELDREVQRP